MPDETDGRLTVERAEEAGSPGLPVQPLDLTPHYANSAQIQFSPYEFMLTFLRAEYLLQGTGPEGKTPVAIATRVALSHRGMKEFLDAAIENYGKFVDENPGTPRLKVVEDATES